MEKSIRRKALVSCVHEGRLLVFRHVDRSPEEVGVQVPAGTVRPDETPRRAAERELVEETGKDSFVVERFLGRVYFDASPYRPEVHERYFFAARLRRVPAPAQSWPRGSTSSAIPEPLALRADAETRRERASLCPLWWKMQTSTREPERGPPDCFVRPPPASRRLRPPGGSGSAASAASRRLHRAPRTGPRPDA
jgi:8-oxo-dGTP pyrophosphatase MutT (NUDIX family)